MNKTISLAAIAMVAVVMGMSAFAPAMADPNNDKSQATSGVCHLYSDGVWNVLWTNSSGQANGHINGHGDIAINSIEQADACFLNQDGSVTNG